VIEWNLPHRHVGQTVRVYDRLDSTNTLAASLVDDPASEGLAILAHEQTAGRGQHGRTWMAPARSSVLLSVLLRPTGEMRRPVVLTAWAAVSVCAVVERLTGERCRIKWPNDVYLAGRKVCGILIEQASATVVGIGLNVSQSAEFFAQVSLTEATSLAILGSSVTSEEVARLLLRERGARWSALMEGDLAGLEQRWKWHFDLIGQAVRIESAEGNLFGRLLEMGFDGLALIEDGPLPRIVPCERVRHVYRAE